MEITNSWFYPLNQTQENDLKFHQIDLSWLHSLDNDKSIYYLINIKCDPDTKVPDGRDLYIFSWFFEPFADQWFLEIYNRNPQAEFVVLTDLLENSFSKLSRVRVFNLFHYSTWIEAIKQVNPDPVCKPLSQRKYKLSALSSRLSEFKFYITCKLLEQNREDIFVSWNRGFDIRSQDNFIFEPTGYSHMDRLLKKYKEILRENEINPDTWENNPLNNCRFDHVGYQDSIINCINETQNISQTPEFGILPGPYISEKTWKPLFAGNAVIFSSQANLKNVLEGLGFQFEYPWAQNFDDEFCDTQRCEILLSHIDWIVSLDPTTLCSMCYDSVQHNLELAWSGKIESMLNERNQNSVARIKKYLTS